MTIQLVPPDAARASTSRRVIISGSKAACMRALSLVQEVLRSNTGKRDYSQHIDEKAAEASGTLLRLAIPRHLVGCVIGKRGGTIRRLRESTGALIEIAKDESGTGTVTLSGPPLAVGEAREQIEELTAEDLPIEVQQTISRMLDEVLVLTVPANRVGKVIGSGGAVIQGLRQAHGVTIDLQKDETGAATVTLRGSMDAMCAAREAIEGIVLAEEGS